MNIDALIVHLQELKQHGCTGKEIVRVWCPEDEKYQEMNGLLINPEKGEVDLFVGESDEDYGDEGCDSEEHC